MSSETCVISSLGIFLFFQIVAVLGGKRLFRRQVMSQVSL